ncbi:MAG: Holliday junction resolvase RuvX [Candidatus Saccharibacteria bacterium]
MPQTTNSNLLALDVGDRRVGVASAGSDTLLANPVVTLTNDDQLIANIKKLIEDNNVGTLVVGLPRNLSGEDTEQTVKVRHFIEQLKDQLEVKIVTQDEALSSVRAEEELGSHGKIFAKADVDKLAACLILEDYINSIKS